MIKSNAYNVEVQPGTRNHKGRFVRNTFYRLVDVNRSGWALICRSKASCHYVDPDCIKQTMTHGLQSS